MELTLDKTLLALLLSLSQLTFDLSGDEIYALEEIGDLLADDLDCRSEIETKINQILEQIMEHNSEFKELYQQAISKLAPLNSSQILAILPEKELLRQELEVNHISRGYFGGKPQIESQEIPNLTRAIAKSDRPDKNAKKLNFLQKYWEMPHFPIF